jgi:hypothetical protein
MKTKTQRKWRIDSKHGLVYATGNNGISRDLHDDDDGSGDA